MAQLTTDQIRDKMWAKESFWVKSKAEREAACRIAKSIRPSGIRYTTTPDDRKGFYVCHLKTVRRTK